MGYKHTPWVQELEGLSHSEKLVLFILTLRANNETRQTWVAVPTIAKECGYSINSRATVRKALQSLSEKGLISFRARRKANSAEQTTHMYTVYWSTTPGAENTDPPVSTTPTPGAGSTTNEEPNEEVINEETYSPSPDGEANVVAPPLSSGDDARQRAENADPVNPGWYHSKARRDALDIIQQTGSLKARGLDEEYFSGLDTLDAHLETHLGATFAWLLDYWEIPKDCATDRRKAAIKLNQILNYAKAEEGPLTFKPQETP